MFTEPIAIFWLKDPEHDSEGVQIGTTPPFTELHARHKRAVIDQTQSFTIVNPTAFSEFTQFMITSETFSWRLSSNNLRVQALKFPVAKRISFNKRIDLKGEFVERLDCTVMIPTVYEASITSTGIFNFWISDCQATILPGGLILRQ